MHFELTREYVDQLKVLIDNHDEPGIAELVSPLHAADIAEIFKELDEEEARTVYLLLDGEKAADVMIEMEEDRRERFLKTLPGHVIARQFIDNMDSDDAADIIGELSDDKKEEVLQHIVDVEQAGDIVDLLSYDRDTAGGLMAKELIRVNENWSIKTCLREMRKQAEEVDEVYYVYVVDDDNKLKGILSLKKMLISDAGTKVKDLYNPDVISVRTGTQAEEVANIIHKYDLVALPVIDSVGRLMGRITIDDVVDVIREEAERDYQMISGISEDVEPSDNVWLLTRARLPWLFIGLLGGILVAGVISGFEHDLRIYPEMAFFIPLIAAMGGNVGVQSSSIIVQGLATKTIGLESTAKKLLKEFSVALVNGITLSGLIFAYNLLASDSYALTITVSSALFVVILFASLFGTFVPLILDKLRVDPALATGPFITTVNDIISLFFYFFIGRILYAVF